MKTLCTLIVLSMPTLLYSCQPESPSAQSVPPSSQPTSPTSITIAVPAESATVYTIPPNFWKAPDEGPIVIPPATVKLKAITVREKTFISLEMLQKFSNEPSALQDFYSQTFLFRYDSQGKPISYLQPVDGNKFIASSNTSYPKSDTLFINSSGYAQRRVFASYLGMIANDYTYSTENFLTTEPIQVANACGLYQIRQLTLNHAIQRGNRVSTQITMSGNSSSAISIQYQFDTLRLNSGLGFDMFRMFSGCSGVFMLYGTPATYIFGAINKNLIRKATVKDPDGDTREYFYRYAFDAKGRVKTLMVLYSFRRLVLGIEGTPYAIHIRNYEYED